MTTRRTASGVPLRSRASSRPRRRSSSGITRSLLTIVETAIASTMIMPVAADSPPMKATSASTGWPCVSGSDSTKVSGSAPPEPEFAKCSSPPRAIGSTNRLISSRYSGKAQLARLTCRSSTFSTTMTWNWRGRKMTDSIASKVSANHCPPANLLSPPRPSSGFKSARAAARAKISPGLSNRPQQTNTPTATKASSLTTDSSAMAATMPSWRSLVSRCRVPKAMVKPASASAMYSVLSRHHGPPPCAAPGPAVSSA